MNEENAIAIAKQYLESKGRHQELAGTVRIGRDKLRECIDGLRACGELHRADRLDESGPLWAIHFRIPEDRDDCVTDPDVNIVSVYDDGRVNEIDVI